MAGVVDSAPLPAFFPLTREGCEESAERFFQCLDEKSFPRGSSSAAKSALIECASLQEDYSKCVRLSLHRKGAKKPISLTEWET